jgi:hypothetical protein
VVVRQRADASDALQRRQRRLIGGVGGGGEEVCLVRTSTVEPTRLGTELLATMGLPPTSTAPISVFCSPTSRPPHCTRQPHTGGPSGRLPATHTRHTRHTPHRGAQGEGVKREGGGQVRCRCSGPSPRRGGSRWRAGGRRGRAPCRCSSC